MTPESAQPSPTAVRNVAVITTGMGGIHPEHMYGTRKPSLWWIFTSKEWIRVPINVFVIEHDNGLVLFDTGLDPKIATDPDYWSDPVTRIIMGRIFHIEIGPDDNLASQLTKAGYDPGDVTTAVLSHLHFDHAGGIRDIPQARLLVAKEAWDHMLEPNSGREGVLRPDIAIPGAKWRLMEFEPTSDPRLAPFTDAYDVMGDGSLIALPTPGHLPGSVSLLIRRHDAPPVLLIGDLTYSEELLTSNQVAGTGDKKTLRQSYARVRAMKAHTPDLVIIAAHDSTAVGKLAGEGPFPLPDRIN